MDKYVKYQSQQGGSFSANQNLIDFHIPGGSGTYDLKDSFVQIMCDIQETESAGAAGSDTGGVYNTMLNWNSTDAMKLHFQNVAVVRNASLSCSASGRIENLRRCDVLRQNLSTYVKDQREEACESYLQINQTVRPINAQQYGINQQFNKTGVDKSVNLNQVPIAISLADVFEFCEVREYDTDRAGNTHVHFECNFDKLVPVENMLDADVLPAGVKSFKTVDGTGTVPNVITIGAAAVATVFKSLDQSPYYVGQRLEIKATPVGAAGAIPADTYRVVSEIGYANDGSLTLKFVSDWASALAAGESYTGGAVSIVPAATLTASFTRAEIVMKRVDMPEGQDQIEYNTYSTEETSGNTATSFRNLYTVEGDAENLLIMFPNGPDDLLSSQNTNDSWRLSLNNIDLTDRDVLEATPLAYDRLSMTLRNMGYRLSNLTENAGQSGNNAPSDTDNAWANVYSKTEFDTDLIANPLFQTAGTKLLQVQINSSGGVKKLILYKQLPRVFSY